jgi:hypothetical protein
MRPTEKNQYLRIKSTVDMMEGRDKTFGSGVVSPGRNFVVTLRMDV